MSSVPKSKQRLSDMEFYRTAKFLRKKIVFYLLRDFGIRDKVRSVGLFQKAASISEEDRKIIQELSIKYDMYNPLVEEYPRWFLEDLRQTFLSILRSLIHNIVRANRIRPNSIAEFNQRRSFQNNAIGDCEVLLEEFQHVIEVLPVDIEKYEEVVSKIEAEIDLLKGWRKSDNRVLTAIKKKEFSTGEVYA